MSGRISVDFNLSYHLDKSEAVRNIACALMKLAIAQEKNSFSFRKNI